VAETLLVDGADRRVAGLYAVSVAGVAAAAVVCSDPRLLGRVPPWWWLVGGAVCGALNAVLPLRRKTPGAKATAAVYVWLWLAPSGWVAWGYAHDPFHHAGPYWLTGAALTVASTLAATVWAMPADFGLPMHAPGPPAAAPGPGAADPWGDLIARVTKTKIVGAVCDSVDDWDTGNGYTAYLTLPPDGTTWTTLQPYEAALAAALKLPQGGGVTVGPHGAHGQARIDVLEQDAMAASITYPGLDSEP
jgi:hypothetical protein